MEVGSCFRDYDDFKESFLSFKKETKCRYGLRNCVTVRCYNRKNATYVREEITFVHVRFICVEPQRNKKKKKQQLSNGCPAYIVLEYCEELDRLVIKEQNSNHIHVGIWNSHTAKKRPASAVHDTSPVLSTSSLRKLPSKRPRINSSHQVIEKLSSNGIPVVLQDSKIGTRATSLLEKSTLGHSTSLPKNETTKRNTQKPPRDHSLIKHRKNSSIHADLNDSEINTRSGQKLTRETLRQKPPIDNIVNEKNLVNEENNMSDCSIHADIQDSGIKAITDTSPPQKLIRKTPQQKPPVDYLLNEEHNRSHLHKNLSKSQNGNQALSPLQVTKPRAARSLPPESQRMGLLQTLSEEDACNELTIKSMSSPIETHTVSLASKENISGSGLERVSDVMKDLLRVDKGSLASFSVDSSENLNRLSFQTSKMRLLFTKFPESLLLHCVQSNSGHVLYAFLVENKERVGQVVHFAVLNEDTTENVSKMLSVFAQFNPEYSKVKVIFIDTSFLHKSALKETFPTAQALLSVYHTVRLIEKKVRKVSAFKASMEIALREVVFSTSAENRMSLSLMLKNVLDPDFHQFLQTNWFSSEMLWYMHVKKGLLSCRTYMDSLQLITHKITSLFSKQPSLETSILYVLEFAGSFKSKGLDNLKQSALKSTHEILKKKKKKSSANLGNASQPALHTSSRFTSLPTPGMLLPKLAQMLPKMGILRPPKQAQPAPVQAQPLPTLVQAPTVSQAPLPTQPPPVLPQPATVLPQHVPVQPPPVLSCPQPVLQSPVLVQSPVPVQPPSIPSHPPPVLLQPPPILAQPPLAQTMVRFEPTLLQSSKPALLQFSSPELALPKHTHVLSQLLPKPESPLSKAEPLLSDSALLLPPTKPSVVTFSNLPPQKLSKDEDSMVVVLRKLCTEVAYQLCLGEWEVVKKSSQVVQVDSARIIVRLVEDVQKVSKDCRTCGCYFNTRYRLPCRHILTILHKNKRPVEEDMICRRWQRKYQKPQLREDDILARVQCSAIGQSAGNERFARMKSLSKELGNLLLQCEGAEFNERCSTLNTIVDSWNQPKKQKAVQVGVLNNLEDLPFLWAKQEEPEIRSSYNAKT